METETSILPKPIIDYGNGKLTKEMERWVEEYALSLHGCSEDTKENYIDTVRRFGAFLKNMGKIGLRMQILGILVSFLSRYSVSTRNLHIHNLQDFTNK